MSAVPASLPLARLLGHAADALAAVRAGRSLTEALERVPAEARPGTQALAFHVLRRLGAATVVRERLAPKAPPPAVDALLLTALALLWPDDERPYAEHTLVDQTVAAARRRTPAAANFVNAVLRRFLREREALLVQAAQQPLGAWNHPPWWVDRVRADWPAQWQDILAANNRRPPMTLRVNARRGSVETYLARLAAAGIAARGLGAQAVLLAQPRPVGQLPGFAEGDVSVQDAAAQLAAPLLTDGLAPGARVLDACAAPGGKTAHLLERADLDVTAIDADAARLARVQETLARLRLSATLVAADARHTAGWWDGRPYDAVLLDAPCTASGIVRRHPDVRWLRRPDDIAALARVQAQLLDALWPLVKPGGRLLYATCSVFRAEGEQQIDAFLQRVGAGAARLDPASPGHLLPVSDNADEPCPRDGFFYALIHKP